MRGLLNTQNQQNQAQSPHIGGYNPPPPNYNMQPGGGHQQQAVPQQQAPPGHSQIRPHFLGGPPQHQTFGQAPSPQNNANYMAANGPRFQNFPRLQQSHPGAMSAQQGPPPPSMRPIIQNVSVSIDN